MSDKRFDPTFELFKREIIARIHKNKRLHNAPIEQAIESGEVVGPGRFIRESGELQVIGFGFKFRKGDRIKLCILNDGKLEPFNKVAFTILKVSFTDIGVACFTLEIPGAVIDPNLEYFLVMDYEPMFDWMLLKNLKENSSIRRKTNLSSKVDDKYIDALNSGQANAIEKILSNQFSGVIQGPPGTGKTEVLAKLVEIAVANNLKVGILSYTNKAVDNAISRISKVFTEGVYRVGDINKVEIEDGVEHVNYLSQLDDYKVFGATTHKFLASKKRPRVDIMILDEASQIPSYFFAGLRHACANIVMIGDNQQLSPVMQTSRHNCETDCFNFFKKDLKDIPMLDTQFRMNETIQEWSSNNYYEGRLKAHQNNAKRDIFSESKSMSFGQSVIKYHDTSVGSDSIAKQVVEFAKDAKRLGNLSWDDIGIISPHRIHAANINRVIQEQLGVATNNEIFADTVDRYQGREKEFIIFSVSDQLSDPSAFLNDYRRINVAITRAKSRFYLVSDYRLRDGEEFSDFLDWCKGISGAEVEEAA